MHNPDLGQQTLPGSESQGEGTGGVLAAWPPRCPCQAVPAKRRVTLSCSSPSQEPLFPATHRDLITLPALFCVTARAVAFCHQKLTWAYIRPAKMTQTGLRLEVPPRGTVAQVIPTAAPSYLPSIHPSTCTFARLRAHLPTRPPTPRHPPATHQPPPARLSVHLPTTHLSVHPLLRPLPTPPPTHLPALCTDKIPDPVLGTGATQDFRSDPIWGARRGQPGGSGGT